MQSAISTAPSACAHTGICDQPKRTASSAISTSQPVHSTNTVTMNTLSQVFCAAWKPAESRSASSAGSRRASHKPTATPRPPISARNTQAAGQRAVPADTNRIAAIAAIQTTVRLIIFETMLLSAGDATRLRAGRASTGVPRATMDASNARVRCALDHVCERCVRSSLRMHAATTARLQRLALRFDRTRRTRRCLRRFSMHLSHLHPAGSRKISKYSGP